MADEPEITRADFEAEKVVLFRCGGDTGCGLLHRTKADATYCNENDHCAGVLSAEAVSQTNPYGKAVETTRWRKVNSYVGPVLSLEEVS